MTAPLHVFLIFFSDFGVLRHFSPPRSHLGDWISRAVEPCSLATFPVALRGCWVFQPQHFCRLGDGSLWISMDLWVLLKVWNDEISGPMSLSWLFCEYLRTKRMVLHDLSQPMPNSQLESLPSGSFKPVPTVARNVMRLFWWNLFGNSISSVWPMPPPTLLRVWSSGNVNQREGTTIHSWWKAMGPNHYRLWIGLRSWTLRLQSDSFSNLWNGHPQVIQHCNGNPHVQPLLHPQNNDVPWS